MTVNHLHTVILTLLTGLLTAASVSAYAAPQSATGDSSSEEIRVSLITCSPGPEVYELVGHAAIRIRTAESDSVWNYGIFDFDAPNFIYRFVKGETDYKLSGYPFAWFVPSYAARGSEVVEQELNLTPEQARRLRQILQTEALPQNATYRYKYLHDNCATRIAERLDSVAGERIVYSDVPTYPTWREAMRHYHANYPWYQFGIDLALGVGLDTSLKGRDDMFAPPVMMEKARTAHFADGRPLVRSERILVSGRDDAVLPPTPFWLTPFFWSIIWLVVTSILLYISVKRKCIFRTVTAVWFGIIGLTGCLSAFLIFISSHEMTSPNILILWLNPLQLVFPLFMWSRRTRFLCKAMSIVDCIVLPTLLLIWPMQQQSANPAFFPLILSTFMLSLGYAINSLKSSYNYEGTAVCSQAKKSTQARRKRTPSKKKK